ncbi:hypothetical protein [Burkholderia multivorans]|uniref:hypothetical protein n=1 Tax=Burkholderia multivorans TaxID=87883 RepID=UPI001C255317|nr:hypothetical protein [Burkholderia multivorans]MBU9543841.1 hypothetical protein [Burkholderia multivorans]MCA8176694.1 hypothetical protein [Burkholderia multivorans]
MSKEYDEPFALEIRIGIRISRRDGPRVEIAKNPRKYAVSASIAWSVRREAEAKAQVFRQEIRCRVTGETR